MGTPGFRSLTTLHILLLKVCVWPRRRAHPLKMCSTPTRLAIFIFVPKPHRQWLFSIGDRAPPDAPRLKTRFPPEPFLSRRLD